MKQGAIFLKKHAKSLGKGKKHEFLFSDNLQLQKKISLIVKDCGRQFLITGCGVV